MKEVSILLIEQQKQITFLAEQIENKISRDELARLAERIDSNKIEIEAKIPDTSSLFDTQNQIVEQKLAESVTYFERTIDDALVSVDTRIAVRIGQNQNDQAILQLKVSQMESKFQKLHFDKTNIDDLCELKEKIRTFDTKLEQIHITPNIQSDLVDLARKFDNFSERVGKIESRIVPEVKQEIKEPIKEEEKEEEEEDENTKENIEEKIEEVSAKLASFESQCDKNFIDLQERIARKTETSLVERLFEKIRSFVSVFREEFDAFLERSEHFITDKQLEEKMFTDLNLLLQDEQSAIARKPLQCLACGKSKIKSFPPSVQGKISDLPSLNASHKNN